jgi:hypothetical protein
MLVLKIKPPNSPLLSPSHPPTSDEPDKTQHQFYVRQNFSGLFTSLSLFIAVLSNN